MSDNFFKINKGLSLVAQSVAPTNPSEGDIYNDATDGLLKYEGGMWVPLGSGSSSALPVTVITADTTLAVNNIYICDSTTRLILTLPSTNAIGDVIEICSANTGGFRIDSDTSVAQTLGYENALYSSTIGNVTTLVIGADDYSSAIKIRAADVNRWTTEYHTGTAVFIGNYFGTGADGPTTISSNTSLTSSTDSDMIVKNYTDLTINSSVTLTTSTRCKGLLLYVKGNLVVNGTISMSSKGANVDATSAGVSAGGLKIRRLDAVGSDTDSNTGLLTGCGTAAVTAEDNQPALAGDGTVFVIPRAGASGGTAVTASGNPASTAGTAGTAGTGGQTGGGGSGGAGSSNNFLNTSGAGATGTCFSGGAAGGGARSGSAALTAGSGAANGGAGGNATNVGDSAAGGAGNPGGNPDLIGGDATAGDTGTGGLLIIIVRGNVTIGSGASIEAKGATGGHTIGTPHAAAGGGSGGGSIILLYAGSLSNSGSISAAGGAGGAHNNPTGNGTGGNGGAGSVQSAQIGN